MKETYIERYRVSEMGRKREGRQARDREQSEIREGRETEF